MANPRTSLARSVLPLLPATVENLTKTGVSFPNSVKNFAFV
jgi:hypothetical protein